MLELINIPILPAAAEFFPADCEIISNLYFIKFAGANCWHHRWHGLSRRPEINMSWRGINKRARRRIRRNGWGSRLEWRFVRWAQTATKGAWAKGHTQEAVRSQAATEPSNPSSWHMLIISCQEWLRGTHRRLSGAKQQQSLVLGTCWSSDPFLSGVGYSNKSCLRYFVDGRLS